MPRIIKRGPQCQSRFNKNDALRKKISRSYEALETKQARLKKQQEYQLAYYENQSCEEQATRLGHQLEYQQCYRDNQSSDERATRLGQQLKCQQSYRDNQSSDERATRLERQLEFQKAYYLSESSEKLINRRKRRLDYQKSHFQEQSNERRIARLSYRRKYQSLRTKGNSNDSYLNIVRSVPESEFNDNLINKNSFGAMESICPHCGAKFRSFCESEKLSSSTKNCYKFSLCCGQGKVVRPPLASPP